MQPAFKKMLDDFCQQQDIVVGAPGVVFFAGEHCVLGGPLAVTQQIPRRVWVGLRRDRQGRGLSEQIRIPAEPGYHGVWLPTMGKLDFHDFKPVAETTEWRVRTQSIQTLVNSLLTRPSIREFWELDGMPLTVSILTDIRSGSGCDFSGCFSVALLTAIRLAGERFGTVDDKRFLEEYLTEDEHGVYTLNWGGKALTQLHDLHGDLHRLNRAALVLEAYFHDGCASGYGTLCCLYPTRWPMIYLRESPSTRGIPEKLQIADWEHLTEPEWEYLEKRLISPRHGLRYHLWPLEHTSLWPHPAPTEYPFSFGLIYSGRPKNTAMAIQKVHHKARELSAFLRNEFTFVHADTIAKWLRERAEPTGIKALRQMAKTKENALDKIYFALVPAGVGAIHAVAECFRQHDATQEERDEAQRRLARTIQGVQDGLGQLGLVDDQARVLTGKLIEFLGSSSDRYALKYVGGSAGGYLLYVGPAGTDLEHFQSVLDSPQFVQGKRETEKPCCEYHSVLEPPDQQGCLASLPLVSSEPERWPMVCYSSQGDRWEDDSSLSKAALPEWKWERLKTQSKRKATWCLVDLDFRRRSDHSTRRSRIYIKGVTLEDHGAGGRGIHPFAHALWCALERGGTCTKEVIQHHLGECDRGLGTSYFESKGEMKKHFLKKIENLPVWQRVFSPIHFYQSKAKDTYTLMIPPASGANSRVYMYLRHKP